VPLGGAEDAGRQGKRGLVGESGDTGALEEEDSGDESGNSEVLEVTVKVSPTHHAEQSSPQEIVERMGFMCDMGSLGAVS
ncbi:unnamed protein product, partial [Sphacelaria rigidula]